MYSIRRQQRTVCTMVMLMMVCTCKRVRVRAELTKLVKHDDDDTANRTTTVFANKCIQIHTLTEFADFFLSFVFVHFSYHLYFIRSPHSFVHSIVRSVVIQGEIKSVFSRFRSEENYQLFLWIGRWSFSQNLIFISIPLVLPFHTNGFENSWIFPFHIEWIGFLLLPKIFVFECFHRKRFAKRNTNSYFRLAGHTTYYPSTHKPCAFHTLHLHDFGSFFSLSIVVTLDLLLVKSTVECSMGITCVHQLRRLCVCVSMQNDDTTRFCVPSLSAATAAEAANGISMICFFFYSSLLYPSLSFILSLFRILFVKNTA